MNLELKELPRDAVLDIEIAMAEYLEYAGNGGPKDLCTWLEHKAQFPYFTALSYIRILGLNQCGTEPSKEIARHILANVRSYGTSNYIVVKDAGLPITAWQVYEVQARDDKDAIEKVGRFSEVKGACAFQTDSYNDAIDQYEENNV